MIPPTTPKVSIGWTTIVGWLVTALSAFAAVHNVGVSQELAAIAGTTSLLVTQSGRFLQSVHLIKKL